MKAFISSSLNDNEKYIITLLTKHLQEKDFVVTTNFNGFYEINNSHLVIGILSKNGSDKKIVLNDWRFARAKRIPNLLLVEDTIRLTPEIRKLSTVIRFNRYFPEHSVEKIKEKLKSSTNMDRSKMVKTKRFSKSTQVAQAEEALAWFLGGAAIVALIALFSEEKK